MLIRSISILICLGVTVLLTGCSDNKVNDPQLTNLRLTSDLIDSLARADHKTAAAQTGKLRTILPESTFLSILEESETSNIYLIQVQPLLDAGDLKGATRIIESGLRDFPMNRHLLRARGQLRHLQAFQQALADAAAPQGADNLRKALTQLETMSAEYPNNTFITQFLADGQQRAAAMEKYELKRAYDSLITEYRLLLQTEPALAHILAAQIEYEKDNIQASRL